MARPSAIFALLLLLLLSAALPIFAGRPEWDVLGDIVDEAHTDDSQGGVVLAEESGEARTDDSQEGAVFADAAARDVEVHQAAGDETAVAEKATEGSEEEAAAAEPAGTESAEDAKVA